MDIVDDRNKYVKIKDIAPGDLFMYLGRVYQKILCDGCEYNVCKLTDGIVKYMDSNTDVTPVYGYVHLEDPEVMR